MAELEDSDCWYVFIVLVLVPLAWDLIFIVYADQNFFRFDPIDWYVHVCDRHKERTETKCIVKEKNRRDEDAKLF